MLIYIKLSQLFPNYRKFYDNYEPLHNCLPVMIVGNGVINFYEFWCASSFYLPWYAFSHLFVLILFKQSLIGLFYYEGVLVYFMHLRRCVTMSY